MPCAEGNKSCKSNGSHCYFLPPFYSKQSEGDVRTHRCMLRAHSLPTASPVCWLALSTFRAALCPVGMLHKRAVCIPYSLFPWLRPFFFRSFFDFLREAEIFSMSIHLSIFFSGSLRNAQCSNAGALIFL